MKTKNVSPETMEALDHFFELLSKDISVEKMYLYKFNFVFQNGFEYKMRAEYDRALRHDSIGKRNPLNNLRKIGFITHRR